MEGEAISIAGKLTFIVLFHHKGSFQLRVDVHDSDFFVDDFVDEIFAELVSFPLGESFSSPTWYTGLGRRSRIELSFRVQCTENFYGRDCNTHCISSERYKCDSDGNRMCKDGNFSLPDCQIQCTPTEKYFCDILTGTRVCRPGYFVLPECQVHCVPLAGQYQCSAENGSRICEKNFYTSTCEIECIPHPTNYTCDPRSGRRVCQKHYFTEECNVFCQERSEGFYDCNPDTGERECLDGYVDPVTYCITCELTI